VPVSERAAVLQALRAEGNEDPQVLSLMTLHWALPPDPARDRTGDRLGDFILEEQLGAGGMGVVYRAQQHIGATTRPVAVKLIHPTLLQTAREEALVRFQAEIGTLVKLEHEGIARIYGGGIAEDPYTHDQLPYLAMELVRGGMPITTYARDYALSWQERLGLFLRVCRAVQYAHEHRVIHRDLKPANILVDSEGCPFVIDFGLAHAYGALLPGAHRAASGTPAYMSPEQVSDAFGPISAKSDVYALGLILYELLTAQHPYAWLCDGTFAQWCQVITETPPLPLHQYSALYGGELEEIMAAALAKRPADRVRVDVLRFRLERYLQKLPPEIDRSLQEARKLQRDTQTVARQQAEVSARLPTTPDAPMLAERHGLDQADAGLPPDPVQAGPPSGSSPVQVTSKAPRTAEHGTSEAEHHQLTVLCCTPPRLEPETDRTAMALRLAQLPPPAQSLLHTAAVIGVEVPLSLVQAVTGLPLEVLSPILIHLHTSGWLAERRRLPEVVYAFCSPLLQQVIYEMVPQAQRCALHTQVLAALTQCCPDRVEDMAGHAFRGAVWDKAVAYYRQAAEQAVASAAYGQAVEYFEQALTSISHLPGHDDTHRRTIDLQFDLSNALVALGDLGRASDSLRQAASLAESIDDGRRLGQACASLTFAYWLAGAYRRANAPGRRAMAIAELLGDFPCRARARLVLGQVYLMLGDYAHAQDCFKQNIACLEDDLRHDCLGMPGLPAVLSRAWLGWGLAELGAFAAGQACCEEALRIAEVVNHRFSLAVACYGAGVVSSYKGDYAQATRYLERGLALCQGEDLPVWFPWIASSLGAAYARWGHVAAALQLLEQAVERADHMGITAYQARHLAWLGEAYLLVGRMVEALECAERALTLARELQEPSSEGQALWLRAEIAAHQVPPQREAAETAYRQAQVLAEAYGLRPLLAHCHFGLGTLYETLDQPQPAHRELSLAAELFRNMDMAFWQRRTEAALTCVA
jgi:serine/threonine protein kinase/tetratricopeptide (TPR) repeat protein